MIRDTLELIVNIVYAFCLFWHYMLILVWSLLVAIVPSTAQAGGGYCNNCYRQTYVQHEVLHEYPQTIVEHQENFFALPNYAMQYAVTPNAIAAAKLGEAQRAEALTRDRLAELTQLYAPQQPVQAQATCQPVCVVPQGYQLVPIQPGQQPATQQQPAQQSPTTFSERAPQSIIQAACIKCHSGPHPKGDLDLTDPITCDQKLDAVAAVAQGDMPKGGTKFSPEQFKQFKKEIAALKNAESSTGSGEAVYQDVAPGGLGPKKPWPPKDLPYPVKPLPPVED